ncbi:uncharacterized protein LODBEIA_P25300 [Lodderomyces beijingensis]|uniref:Sphingoid long-chain base transporter RSB1 n=1 Tax=Lodderomyces beijingensis TaxID=1775926 RepID=A0ABP0ZJJ3_9ASCO
MWYSYFFIASDVASLLAQAAGGAVAAAALKNHMDAKPGTDALIVGIAVQFLFNAKLVREYRSNHLEQFYKVKFAAARAKKLFGWMPLAVTIAVVAVYICCVYRVVKLAMGFSGYLYEHEVYILVLDAAMIATCGIVFLPFHPIWVFGKKNIVKSATIKQNDDEQPDAEISM